MLLMYTVITETCVETLQFENNYTTSFKSHISFIVSLSKCFFFFLTLTSAEIGLQTC